VTPSALNDRVCVTEYEALTVARLVVVVSIS
jgi:hypothetical protein